MDYNEPYHKVGIGIGIDAKSSLIREYLMIFELGDLLESNPSASVTPLYLSPFPSLTFASLLTYRDEERRGEGEGGEMEGRKVARLGSEHWGAGARKRGEGKEVVDDVVVVGVEDIEERRSVRMRMGMGERASEDGRGGF